MLDKLIADAALSPQSFHKIAGTLPTKPETLNERAEQLVAGLLSAIDNLEGLAASFPDADLRAIEPQINDAYERMIGIWAAVSRARRNEEAGL